MSMDRWNYPEAAGMRIGAWWFVWHRTDWRPLFDPPGKAHRLTIHHRSRRREAMSSCGVHLDPCPGTWPCNGACAPTCPASDCRCLADYRGAA